MLNASLRSTGFKKKLYKCRPRDDGEKPKFAVEAQRTKLRAQPVDCDPLSIERGVRQMLADKVSGHLVGVWLLVAEELRLGTWDLLRAWTRHSAERAEPRLALQLMHEAALCTTGIRADRTLTNRGGFELAAGLPFIASDSTIHSLLAEHPVADSLALQVMLAKLRRAGGDFRGKVLALDPHRMRSYSKRHMRRHAHNAAEKPVKVAQTFWLLDADTKQPVCFTTATSSRTVTQVMPSLLDLTEKIFAPGKERILLLADTEHQSTELLRQVASRPGFEILVPMANTGLCDNSCSPSPRSCSLVVGRGLPRRNCLTRSNTTLANPIINSCNAVENGRKIITTRRSWAPPIAMRSRH